MAGVWRNAERNKKLLNRAATERNFIAFDTETTGLGRDSEIVELAAARLAFREGKFKIAAFIDVFIKPKKPISKKASEVNGLTNEFLADKPSEEKMLPLIADFFGDKPTICAYNSSFDVRQMKAMYARQGRSFEPSLEIDFYQMAKDAFCCEKMQDMKLATVARAYGVEEGIEFHSAFDDVKVLVRVINALTDDLKRNSNLDGDAPAKAVGLYFSEGYRGNERLYVSTSVGRIRYLFKEDKWESCEDGLDLKKIRMDMIERQVFAMTGAEDYKSLKKICEASGTGRMV